MRVISGAQSCQPHRSSGVPVLPVFQIRFASSPQSIQILADQRIEKIKSLIELTGLGILKTGSLSEKERETLKTIIKHFDEENFECVKALN